MRAHDAATRRTISNYAGPRALEPGVESALRGLGYRLVPIAGGDAAEDRCWRPALRLVDERHLDRIPDVRIDPDTPLVTLVGSRPKDLRDPRIAGSVARPASLIPLYQLFQLALEEHPRRVPRVATQLPARCIRSDHRWPGAVVSLSEGGCLLRSSERIREGTELNVQIALPGAGLITARARCVHESEAEIGLAFSETTHSLRASISGFVNQQLAV